MVNDNAIRVALRNALMEQDAYGVADLFQLPSISENSTANQPSRKQQQQQHTPQSLIVDEVDYGGLLASLLDAIAAAEVGDADATFQAQAAVHSTFNRLFGSSEGNWLVPALIVVCKNTNYAAMVADRQQPSDGNAQKGQQPQHQAKLQKAVPILQDSYSKTFNDRVEYQPGAPFDSMGSKKAGVLGIVNVLFAMYFRLNILRLCKNLIRPVETRKLHESGTMADMVTYRYYIGRLNMFEDQHGAAEVSLDYALRHCHRASTGNKKRILRYLIPVKLLRGKLPTAYVLDKYSLDEFKPLVEGIQKGDLRTFQDGLVKYQHLFIRQGTYLILEKCKTVVYRNLFKRIHKILDKTQISLNHAATTFKWLGMPIDLDEIECILANLIYRGFIRGYLSHNKRVLVLSKRDPFPTSSVISQ